MSLYQRGLNQDRNRQLLVSGEDGLGAGMAGIGVLVAIFAVFVVMRGPDKLQGGK